MLPKSVNVEAANPSSEAPDTLGRRLNN